MKMCIRGARSNRTKALRLKGKNEKREKMMETTGGRRRTKSSALGIESSESGGVPGVRL